LSLTHGSGFHHFILINQTVDITHSFGSRVFTEDQGKIIFMFINFPVSTSKQEVSHVCEERTPAAVVGRMKTTRRVDVLIHT
jgi:hypothetical protein